MSLLRGHGPGLASSSVRRRLGAGSSLVGFSLQRRGVGAGVLGLVGRDDGQGRQGTEVVVPAVHRRLGAVERRVPLQHAVRAGGVQHGGHRRELRGHGVGRGQRVAVRHLLAPERGGGQPFALLGGADLRAGLLQLPPGAVVGLGSLGSRDGGVLESLVRSDQFGLDRGDVTCLVLRRPLGRLDLGL